MAVVVVVGVVVVAGDVDIGNGGDGRSGSDGCLRARCIVGIVTAGEGVGGVIGITATGHCCFGIVHCGG